MSSVIRKLAGPAAVATFLMIGALGTAATADGIRVPSNTCSWEDFSWEELTPSEQRVWAQLGWNARLWDSPDQMAVPASSEKDWDQLNKGERTAAWQLGFTKGTWEADCP